MENVSDYVLGGSVANYLDVTGSDVFGRLNPHLDWWDARYEAGLDPYSKGSSGPILSNCSAQDRKGRPLYGVNFASQDYLSLASHPRVKEAGKKAIDRYGVHSAGSPALMGNTQASLELESALADFLHLKECVVYPTGWSAAYGAIRGLMRASDHIVIDRLAHASLMEGARSTTGNVHTIPHLSLDRLDQTLKKIRAESQDVGILVVTESLFSMDSDTPDLAAHQELATKYGALLLVDVAHDLGCIGPTGRGHLEIQGMLGKVDIVMGSFSKTFASNGGFVASNHRAMRLALRYGSCPLTFSNAISPVQACVVIEALRIVCDQEGRQRRESLNRNAVHLRNELMSGGFDVMGAPSAIVPVVLGDSGRSRLVSKYCLEQGALVNLVEYPAVARSASRFRLQVMADHSFTDIDGFMVILRGAIDGLKGEFAK